MSEDNFEVQSPISTSKDSGISENLKYIENSKNFLISNIKEGDVIPVGGDSMFSNEMTKFLKCETEGFLPFFEKVNLYSQNMYNETVMDKWFVEHGINFDSKLFGKLMGFSVGLEKKYPNSDEAESKRESLYKEKKTVTLFELFDSKSTECAERAALAQLYLQRNGVNSTLVGGEVIWGIGENDDIAFPEPHSFLLITDEKNNLSYIWDPSTPIQSKGTLFPRISSINQNFIETISKNKKIFFEAKDILTDSKAYYGVGDLGGINTKAHIA